MKKHADSHLDHGLTADQIAYLLGLDVSTTTVVVQTIELPPELGTVPCGLHGPAMGDAPVAESEVTYARRGNRVGASRLVARPARDTRLVTIVAGPHAGQTDVLYTAFGGPAAPREPWELAADTPEGVKSAAFWAEHALSEGA